MAPHLLPFFITHRLPLFRAPQAYQMFRDKWDGWRSVHLRGTERSTGGGTLPDEVKLQ